MSAFEVYGLSSEIISAIKELGFEQPTPIQELTIPAILDSKRDLIGLAQTGTGKTAGFGLPIINQLDVLSDDIQALILCPTRELCIQITKDLTNYSKNLEDLKVTPVYGGTDINTQSRDLKKNPQVVVGTPGRVMDMIFRKYLDISKIKWLVLDEADEMLDMGFKDDLDKILSTTPKEKQTLLFSATMPSSVYQIAKKYMKDPEELSAGKRNIGAEGIDHIYYPVKAQDRYAALKRISDVNPDIYGIVFCRTRKETKEVAEKLIKDGYNADALHGDLSQGQRDHVMNRFRSKVIQLLVATDVAARGLDVNDLTHIINYNLPDELELYIHRSGRTARAGKKGVSISIIHSRDNKKIKELERITRKKFELKKVPTGPEICAKQLFKLIDKVEKIEVDEQLIEPYIEPIYKKLEWLSREDLIKKFVSVEFNRFLNYYKDAEDLNLSEKVKEKKERKVRAADYSRLFINIGTKDNLTPQRLMGLINEQMGGNNVGIGKIDLLKKFSFFEIAKEETDELLLAFSAKPPVFEGIKVAVEVSKPESKSDNWQTEKRTKPKFDSKKKSSWQNDKKAPWQTEKKVRPERRKRKFD